MTKYFKAGEAIEGKAVDGESRKGLVSFGASMDDEDLNTYKARFNVKATVETALPAKLPPLSDESHRDVGDAVVCDAATVQTRDVYKGAGVSASSGRHQSQFWRLTKQSLVVIDQAHPEIESGARRREEEAAKQALGSQLRAALDASGAPTRPRLAKPER